MTGAAAAAAGAAAAGAPTADLRTAKKAPPAIKMVIYKDFEIRKGSGPTGVGEGLDGGGKQVGRDTAPRPDAKNRDFLPRRKAYRQRSRNVRVPTWGPGSDPQGLRYGRGAIGKNGRLMEYQLPL